MSITINLNHTESVIENRIETEIEHELGERGRFINVSVGKTVRLSGLVADVQSKRDAERIARRHAGSRTLDVEVYQINGWWT